MTISEHDRHHLHTTLDRVLGPQEATVLMSHLPPVGWADVATKSDIAHLQTELVHLEDRLDLRMSVLEQSLRAEFHQAFGTFRDEANDGATAFQTEMRNEFAAFQTEMRNEFASFREQIHRDRIRAQRQLIFVFVAAMVGVIISLAVG